MIRQVVSHYGLVEKVGGGATRVTLSRLEVLPIGSREKQSIPTTRPVLLY